GSEEAWRTVLSDLEEAHRSLHATVLELEDARLEDPVAGCDPTVRGLLLGVLQHNVYHAGQISVLKKAEATPGGAA
ncbi:MAG: DinB family protein, partial [bacterium]|nr:DinB family protein [bacterium]